MKKAHEEHAIYVDTLREQNIEVIMLETLLEDIANIPQAREWIIAHRITEIQYGYMLA